MPYFDSPPGQRVLRKFTIRRDQRGRWVASETHGLLGGVFLSCKEALRLALYELDGTSPGFMSSRPRRLSAISGCVGPRAS